MHLTNNMASSRGSGCVVGGCGSTTLGEHSLWCSLLWKLNDGSAWTMQKRHLVCNTNYTEDLPLWTLLAPSKIKCDEIWFGSSPSAENTLGLWKWLGWYFEASMYPLYSISDMCINSLTATKHISYIWVTDITNISVDVVIRGKTEELGWGLLKLRSLISP